MKTQNKYVDLKTNGRLFPTWVLHNFKKFKLPSIIRKDNEDPCSAVVKLELRKYQEFLGQYLSPTSPYNSILLYHGLGSGKTATCINLINILYNYNHNINVIFLIKASLHNDPWMIELYTWLGRNPDETSVEDVKKLARYNTLHFCHYDSPYADKDFMNIINGIDTTKTTMYIIDEVHNFINNVYSNINSKIGKRAKTIYEYILHEKKENNNTKVILISATPGINTPFELALMFNLLRPGIFPSSEEEFKRFFITSSTYPILNPQKKNMFERRIMGLVSYYIGATPDLYARQELKYINLPMSEYQYDIYRIFERLETSIQRKMNRYKKVSKLYKTYTRQACNFVVPRVSRDVTGEFRPRPGKFRISDKTALDLEKGKQTEVTDKEAVDRYLATLNHFMREIDKYFTEIYDSDTKEGRTIHDDLTEFKNGEHDFLKYYQSAAPKSKLTVEMYKSSPKMTCIVFMCYISPGKVMIYTNYVIMEGIDIMKIYLKLAGYDDCVRAEEYMGFCEYHGRIDFKDRIKIKNMFNDKNNVRGDKCKIILLSPSATEGIQLYNIRQEHILEPYWTEVRIQQVIGRGIRQCSHKDLPMAERVVNVYRYKVVKPDVLDEDDVNRWTTDEYIEDMAKAKDNLIQSFLSAMKESAVDCELFKSHNMMSQTYYCFKFPEDTIMTKNIGPAYKEDIKDDVKYDSGLYASNSRIERIRVIQIMAVYVLTLGDPPTYSKSDKYWYHVKTGIVYDYDTHYPVGKVQFVNGLPNKLDKDTYIMSDVLDIPTIEPTMNL